MNLAVLLYQYALSNPSNVPVEWPAEVIELGDATNLPGANWTLMTTEEYALYNSQYQSAYDAWFTSHFAPTASQIVQAKIFAAIKFGQELMIKFATENVLLGITQAGKTIAVSDYLTKMQSYILSGSLYAAISEIDAKIADTNLETNYAPFLTVARLTSYKQEIQAFLGA